jgi:pyridoxamine 5'-phosphate oxidase-like protein
MSYSMTKAERESFLADTHVAVISVERPGRAPLTVPVWYDYRPGGDVHIVTGAQSKKTACIRTAGRISLCVQTETPPYKYVSVEGPVTFGDPDFERDMRQVAHRYLGEAMGEMYLQLTAAERVPGAAVLLRFTPERWLSVDYSKMVG